MGARRILSRGGQIRRSGYENPVAGSEVEPRWGRGAKPPEADENL